MPILKFQCQSCGLLFKRRTKKQAEKCACGEIVSSAKGSLSVGFSSDVEGMDVQDTGMDSFDLDYDRVIGEDARKKWDTIYQRRKDKWDLINSNKGVSGADILREDDGTYLIHSHAGEVLRSNRDQAMETIKLTNDKTP